MPVLMNYKLKYRNKVIVTQDKCQYSSIFRQFVRLTVNLFFGYKIGYSFLMVLLCP